MSLNSLKNATDVAAAVAEFMVNFYNYSAYTIAYKNVKTLSFTACLINTLKQTAFKSNVLNKIYWWSRSGLGLPHLSRKKPKDFDLH